jgi:hypothetical protein
MKTLTLRLLLPALLIAVPGIAAAEDNDDNGLGITMTVVGDEEFVDERAFVNEIDLPETAATRAQENVRSGNEAASQARQQGSEFGQQRAEEGRNRSGGPGNGGPPDGPPGGPPESTPAP